MTEAEVRELLAVCASYDGTEYGEPAVVAWRDSLDCPWVPNLSFDEALGAVGEHYRCSPVRVTPSDVLGRIRDDRAAQVAPAMGLPHMGVPPTAEYRKARAELDARNAARRAGR